MKTRRRFKCLPLFLVLIALAGCPPPTAGWVRLHGGADTDNGYDLQQTADGGYIVAGKTSSFGTTNGDMYLLKLTANGYQSWYYTYGGFQFEHGYRVVQASDGGYVMAGTTTSFGAGGVDACLVKVDSTGAWVWNRTYGGAGDDFALGLAKTSDGGYVLAGTTDNSQDGSLDIYLVKTDADGYEDWSTNIDYGGEEQAAAVVETTNGYAVAGIRIVITSDIKGIDDGDSPGFAARMCLVRTDDDGEAKWMKEYGDFSIGLDLRKTSDGGYILAGASEGSWLDPLEEDDGYAVKTDENGVEAWSLVYDTPAEDALLLSVNESSDGGYIFAGGQGNAALLLKTDEDGMQE